MKTAWVIRRLLFIIRIYPKRIARLFTYYFHPFYVKPKFRVLPFMLAECLLIFDIYEILSNILKRNIRPLTNAEILRGSEIFGKSIDFQLIMIDDKAHYVVRDKVIAYVSFNTINSHGALPPDIFIHELVHVWQYQNFGAGYIMQALWAQRTKAGYDYTDVTANGGLSLRGTKQTEGWFEIKSIHQFNAEQQGDLVQDYYRLKTGLRAQWEYHFTMMDLEKYERFMAEIKGEMGR